MNRTPLDFKLNANSKFNQFRSPAASKSLCGSSCSRRQALALKLHSRSNRCYRLNMPTNTDSTATWRLHARKHLELCIDYCAKLLINCWIQLKSRISACKDRIDSMSSSESTCKEIFSSTKLSSCYYRSDSLISQSACCCTVVRGWSCIWSFMAFWWVKSLIICSSC